MFGRKKTINEPEVSVVVDAMPTEFYGGVNPVVKFKTTEKEISLQKESALTAPERKAFEKASAVGGGSKIHLANLLTSPKFLLLSASILFVVFGAVAGVYYWQQAKATKNTSANLATNIPGPIVTPVEEIIPIATTTEEVATTTSEATTTLEEVKQSILDVPPTYPSITLGESLDADKDDVTDVAEELYKTDLGTPDSDKDKYTDGHEIYNLYNPIGKEPLKIIDSGLVSEFINPVFSYKMYYPTSWAVGNVDANYRSVLFSTLNGENVEVRSIEKNTVNENFSDWFARWAPNEKIGDLKSFVTAFADKGWMRSDGLVYYFDTPNRVYVLVYHTTDSAVVNYKIVIKMMARSFRLPLSNEILPTPIVEESGIAPANQTTTSIPATNL